ncbi:DsrE family protein [Marinobacter sp.]|uniref:DsrE family protein n=1 Tax=Marinobacter sp. TaxID=50741 RepID=UPI001B47362B|nr:DsrE family protein [Marinobacter sp.]MBQ0833144.1 DsrE family protein [Marinobacter sp.]
MTINCVSRKQVRRTLCFLIFLAVHAGVQAEEPFSEAKPFAEEFLLLQLSDNEAAKQNMALSVAANLLEFYGPDMIDIEITTFGPGVELLYADNSRLEKITSLMAQGVRFSVCINTIKSIERNTGERPELHPQSIPVDVGVAHILERVAQGYVLVRP